MCYERGFVTTHKYQRFFLILAAGWATACCFATRALAQESSPPSLPDHELTDLTRRLAGRAKDVQCKPQDCKLLIVDFVLDSGQTSPLGIALADQLSEKLASQASFSVVPRSALRQFLEQERIPAKEMESDDAMRWLGEKLGATAVVLGRTYGKGDSLETIVRVLSVGGEGEKAKSKEERLVLTYSNLAAALAPLDSYPAKGRVLADESGVERAGVNGVSSPVCIYCPLPSYTGPARKAKIQGSAVLDVLVLRDGSVRDAKVVRGLPFDLNKAALNDVGTWKLKPAMRGGRAIDARVIIEVTFRIF